MRSDGYITSDGYFRLSGTKKTEHLLIAEKALGHSLPPKAVVHHFDRVRTNNAPANLVICPNQKYHKLLHQRTEALEASGNANWRKCWLCQKHDAPENLYIGLRKVHHAACENARQRQKYQERKHVNHV